MNRNNYTQKIRRDARISSIPLAKYTISLSAARRRAIILDQIAPRPPIVAVYSEVRAALRADLFERWPHTENLRFLLNQLQNAHPNSVLRARKVECQKEAVTALLEFGVPRFDCDFVSPHLKPSSVDLGGVRVSVDPDLLLFRKAGDERAVGCLQVYYSKTHPLSEDEANLISAIAFIYSREKLQALGKAKLDLCPVYDVFSGKLHAPPLRYRKREKELRASCDEILSRWADLVDAKIQSLNAKGVPHYF